MLYQHKKTKSFCELISSGPGYCIIISLLPKQNVGNFLSSNSVYNNNASMGKVFKGSKEDFKKFFKKSSPEKAMAAGYELIPEDMIEYAKKYCEGNIFNIVNNTDEFMKQSLIKEGKRKAYEKRIEDEQKSVMDGYKEDGEVSVDEVAKVFSKN